MNANETSGAVMQVAPFCLNRQAAIAFSSFKPAFFDEKVRPRLTELRAGTSVLYLREELERVIRTMFREESEAEPADPQHGEITESNEPITGQKKWEKRQPASTKPPMAVGKSTSVSTGYDFASALTALKTRKAG